MCVDASSTSGVCAANPPGIWCALPILLVLVTALFGSPAWAEPETDFVDLSLGIGEQRVIPTEGVQSYSEGTPGIIDVRLTKDARDFIVVGKQAGSTTLLFLLTNGAQREYRVVVGDPKNAAALAPDGKDNGKVQERDNVRLDFYFVQLDTTSSRGVGVSWPASFGGGTATASFDLLHGSFQSATAVVTDQALPRLDFAESSGWAKVERQAAVITANGEEASFSGGGEVNIPVRGALAAEIRTIEFGSKVKVLPRYDRDSGRVELTLNAEVADLTPDNGTGAPGRSKTALHTVVNLAMGQSLVLAGLDARSESWTRSGLPVLSRIPILGALFGSTSDQKDDSRNLVLIVPTVLDAVPMTSRDRIREALGAYEKFDGELDGMLTVPKPSDTASRRGGK